VAGASGRLGTELVSLLGDGCIGMDLPVLDITSPVSIEKAVAEHDPAAIVNCAAITDVDLCQRNPELAIKVHVDGVANLASTGRRLITISTDHVFGGERGGTRTVPYDEDDRPSPVNVYGESKLAGESEALGARSDNIVIRTSWLFSGREGLCPFIWNSLASRGRVKAVKDQVACFTYAPDLAGAILRLLNTGYGGIFHLVNTPGLSPAVLARRFAGVLGGMVEEVHWSDLGLDAPRPAYSELRTSRRLTLPGVEDALERWRKDVTRNA